MREEYAKELLFMKNMILEKFVLDELDINSLLRIIDRLEDIAYFIGRLDGEKYKEEITNEFK